MHTVFMVLSCWIAILYKTAKEFFGRARSGSKPRRKRVGRKASQAKRVDGTLGDPLDPKSAVRGLGKHPVESL